VKGLCLDHTKLDKDQKTNPRTNDIVTFMQDTDTGKQLREIATGTKDIPSVLFISELPGLTQGRSRLITKLKDPKSWTKDFTMLRTGPTNKPTRHSPDAMVKLWSACANQWATDTPAQDNNIMQFDNWTSADAENFGMGELDQLADLSPVLSLYRPGADQRSLIAWEKEAGTRDAFRRYSAFLVAHRNNTGGHIDTIGFGQKDLGQKYTKTAGSTFSTTSAIGIHVAGWKGWWSSRGSTLKDYIRWAKSSVSIADGLTTDNHTLLDIWANNVIPPRLGGVNMLGTSLTPPPPSRSYTQLSSTKQPNTQPTNQTNNKQIN
jgi:hypothetical protein